MPKPGDSLGPYLLGGLLGAPGADRCSVFLAEGQHRKVMLAFLDDANPAARQRFSAEARALQRVKHDNLVEVVDVADNWFTVERLRGHALAEVLRRDGKPPLSQAMYIAWQASSALRAAHDAGLVHRGLSPQSVFLVDQRGHRGVVKLVDFGMARDPAYLAPEQHAGPGDVRADVYAFGLLLFELATGRRPFVAASPLALKQAHEAEAPPAPSSLAEVPATLDALILQCLSKDPAARPAGMAEVQESLREIAILVDTHHPAPAHEDPTGDFAVPGAAGWVVVPGHQTRPVPSPATAGPGAAQASDFDDAAMVLDVPAPPVAPPVWPPVLEAASLASLPPPPSASRSWAAATEPSSPGRLAPGRTPPMGSLPPPPLGAPLPSPSPLASTSAPASSSPPGASSLPSPWSSASPPSPGAQPSSPGAQPSSPGAPPSSPSPSSTSAPSSSPGAQPSSPGAQPSSPGAQPSSPGAPPSSPSSSSTSAPSSSPSSASAPPSSPSSASAPPSALPSAASLPAAPSWPAAPSSLQPAGAAGARSAADAEARGAGDRPGAGDPPAGAGAPPAGAGAPPAGAGAPPAGAGAPPAGAGAPPAGAGDPPAGAGEPPAGAGEPPAGAGAPRRRRCSPRGPPGRG